MGRLTRWERRRRKEQMARGTVLTLVGVWKRMPDGKPEDELYFPIARPLPETLLWIRDRLVEFRVRMEASSEIYFLMTRAIEAAEAGDWNALDVAVGDISLAMPRRHIVQMSPVTIGRGVDRL